MYCINFGGEIGGPIPQVRDGATELLAGGILAHLFWKAIFWVLGVVLFHRGFRGWRGWAMKLGLSQKNGVKKIFPT